MEVSPERMFFMYAFPALAGCSSASEEKIRGLEKLLISGGAPSWDELNELVPTAIQRKNRVAKGKRLELESVDAVKEYWWVEHNRIINSGEEGYADSPSHAREACKVSFVEVVGLESDAEKIVYYNKRGDEMRALTYFSDLEVGDFVTLHLGRVVEKISLEDYREYRE